MSNKKWISGTLKLSVKGEPLEVQMSFPPKPVRPQRILPVLQKMTNSFVDIGVKEAERRGESISCAKGCGACCSQLVPISEIEVHHIANVVEEMPEPRRRIIKEKFEKAVRHFHEIGWFEKIDTTSDFSSEEVRKIAVEYFQENISCPFLEDQACSIHPVRPLSCREYLVTSPAKICSTPTPETVKAVEIPHKMSRTLLKVWRNNYSPEIAFVPLVRALEWAKMHSETSRRKMGTEWMNEIIQDLGSKKAPQTNKV